MYITLNIQIICLLKIGKVIKQYEDQRNDPLTQIKKVVTGKMVMKVRGITKPCKEIGDIIKDTIDWIADNNIDLNDIDLIENHIKETK